ncbi:lysophosphatidylcholine acyltransferase/ lyso-PAF acetyltransferase [Monoraphidium neglectum]|uniref:Lysophosphatidylcholine acyltransferase/ lyso-PAF acetyltransferase n=1 Tax=Monoraphidium neglectum TaxID=145388 RepID=A0A0D2MDH7_9CHLO|nr:lysophosphatidylcholine acyltransferase/ lyso-PAF acetyltransferase [Monoraphidium neglectum]KIY98806.1 lysophosphatidylcholine acyltransferase/ lyso-PAF acetyltransferase [Monoraphidium neglectum]|eukprot:XP_013897826.1 lysophosphatidylcholine acyltransferase/ lyso-PAF acetyltransferase [Monoraphidium neglectum]
MMCVASYYILLRLLLFVPAGVLNRRLAAFWGRFWSRACLLALGFVRISRVREERRSPKLGDRPRWQVAIVSNHIGWADILIHMSRNLPSFVARDGTQDIRMIGLISRRIECIYVDREKRNGSTGGASAGVGEQVRQRMLHSWAHPEEEHRPMLLFPEGTTSNGTSLLPFKTGAFLAGVPVQPVIIKYGEGPVSPAWESISALRHMLLMLTTPFHSVTCYEQQQQQQQQQKQQQHQQQHQQHQEHLQQRQQLRLHRQCQPQRRQSPEDEQKDPKLYAANVRQYMLRYSGLKPSDATLEDKRRYQADLRQRLAEAAGSQGGGSRGGGDGGSGMAGKTAES